MRRVTSVIRTIVKSTGTLLIVHHFSDELDTLDPAPRDDGSKKNAEDKPKPKVDKAQVQSDLPAKKDSHDTAMDADIDLDLPPFFRGVSAWISPQLPSGVSKEVSRFVWLPLDADVKICGCL